MYPIMLNVSGKKCVVIGGGRVALRKAKKLYECDACVTAVSPVFCDGFDFAEKITDEYNVKYIENAVLVIGATDDSKLNKKIADDAREKGILVSLANDAEQSDFMSPCSKRTGNITVAVSTDGKYPLLAKKLCEIKSEDMDFYNELLSALEKYRHRILSKYGDTKYELLERLVSDEMIRLAKADMTAFMGYLKNF